MYPSPSLKHETLHCFPFILFYMRHHFRRKVDEPKYTASIFGIYGFIRTKQKRKRKEKRNMIMNGFTNGNRTGTRDSFNFILKDNKKK